MSSGSKTGSIAAVRRVTRRLASRRVSRSAAASSATGSAWWRISPPSGTRIGWSSAMLATTFRPGMSSAVTTATRVQSKAGSSSIASRRAWGTVERIVAPYQAPGNTRSSAYSACPVSLAGPSRRVGIGTARPGTGVASRRDRARPASRSSRCGRLRLTFARACPSAAAECQAPAVAGMRPDDRRLTVEGDVAMHPRRARPSRCASLGLVDHRGFGPARVAAPTATLTTVVPASPSAPAFTASATAEVGDVASPEATELPTAIPTMAAFGGGYPEAASGRRVLGRRDRRRGARQHEGPSSRRERCSTSRSRASVTRGSLSARPTATRAADDSIFAFEGPCSARRDRAGEWVGRRRGHVRQSRRHRSIPRIAVLGEARRLAGRRSASEAGGPGVAPTRAELRFAPTAQRAARRRAGVLAVVDDRPSPLTITYGIPIGNWRGSS